MQCYNKGELGVAVLIILENQTVIVPMVTFMWCVISFPQVPSIGLGVYQNRNVVFRATKNSQEIIFQESVNITDWRKIWRIKSQTDRHNYVDKYCEAHMLFEEIVANMNKI